VVDGFSRRVLAWRLSITLETEFCLDAVNEALARHGKPEIFNTDQGSQFTSVAFTVLLQDEAIAISMDGLGAWRDNVFVERLWRSVKYEEMYLRAYDSVSDARASLGRYLDFYNGRRPHSSLGGEDAGAGLCGPSAAEHGSVRGPPVPWCRQDVRLNRQAIHLSEPKRCSEKPSHICQWRHPPGVSAEFSPSHP